jgi:hypothetical protein
MELISCHDCKGGVSFSAARCPHCGSREPAGPYRHSRREIRRHRIEYRNDRNLIFITLGLGAAGSLLGISTSASTFGAVIYGVAYGTLGLLIGVPVAFVINVTRGWR